LLSDENSQLFLQCIYIPLSLFSALLYSVDLLGYFLNVNLKFIVRGYRLLVLGLKLPELVFQILPLVFLLFVELPKTFNLLVFPY
jgi:hypothetical protein